MAIGYNKFYASLRPNGTAIENVIMRDPSKSYLVERHLGGLFKCSWPLLQKLNKSGFPTVRRSCFIKISILPNTPRYQCNWSTFAFERNSCCFSDKKAWNAMSKFEPQSCQDDPTAKGRS